MGVAPAVHHTTGMKALVVYYSRSGNTQRVARAIAAELGADLEPIVEPRKRLGLRAWMRSGYEATKKLVVPIEPPLHDLAQYDLVVVGTPTWASSPSSPVRTFLTVQRANLRNVAFFATCGGRGAEHAIKEMGRIAGKEPADVLVLREDEIHGGFADKLSRFVREIRLVLEPRKAA